MTENFSVNTGSLRGELRHNEPLTKLNTWHVGGAARQTYRPADIEDLSAFLQTLPAGETIIWLGLGSNVLIPDSGLDATVILSHSGLNAMHLISETQVQAQAGVACAQLSRFCAKHGLGGGYFFSGIPGTVGGALAMNAGAYGGETWEVVQSVETIDRQGQVRLRMPSDFAVAYRHVQAPENEWFVSATLTLSIEDAATEQDKIRALIKKRRAQQPIGKLSCGSVFRNPPGHHAAALIEQCGLKGMRLGGAIVSEKHANFILNEDKATAADIEQLILYVQQHVQAQTGILLQPEVKFL